MAQRTFTIDELVTRLEELTDTQNDAHLSSAEKFRIVNSAIAETWDAIIQAGLGEKYVKSSTFTTVSGTLTYPIFTATGSGGAGAEDFYRIHAVYVDEGNGQLRPLHRISPFEVQSFRPPASAVSVKLYYIPYSPVLTTGQSFDGINGWEEHTLMVAARSVKMKKDDSYNQYLQRQRELEGRMAAMGNTDFGEPKRVARKRKRANDPWHMFNQNLNCYVLRGDKLELMYNYGYVP